MTPSTSRAAMSFLSAEAGGNLRVDCISSLESTVFIPAGEDLLIVAANEQQITVKGYYDTTPRPTLICQNGMELTGDMVASMTRDYRSETFSPFKPFPSEQPEASPRPSPEASRQGLTLDWGEYAVITAAAWQDTLAEIGVTGTAYKLVTQGQRGWLTARGLLLKSGDVFSLEDIEAGKVIYYHDETSGQEDTVLLAVSGDAQESLIKLNLSIRNPQDQMPAAEQPVQPLEEEQIYVRF